MGFWSRYHKDNGEEEDKEFTTQMLILEASRLANQVHEQLELLARLQAVKIGEKKWKMKK